MVVYLSLILNCALSGMTYYYFCVVYCYFEIIIIIKAIILYTQQSDVCSLYIYNYLKV